MASPIWLCNNGLKPNFQPIISQTNNGCNRLSLILAKLLLLDISCKIFFALPIVTALTACLFLVKKCVKISVFNVKTIKICWRLRATTLDLLSLRRLGVSPVLLGVHQSWAGGFTTRPRLCYPLFAKSWVATGTDIS